MENRDLYEFGPFRMDANEKCLFRGDSPIALTPRAFDTLLVLVKKSGRTVQKDELLKEVWDGAFVEEAVVAQNVFAIRRVLGPEYIETVPKRGYRFVAEVKEIQPQSTEASPEQQTKLSIVIEDHERPEDQFSYSLRTTAVLIAGRHYRIALVLLLSIAMVGVFLLWRSSQPRTTDPALVVRSVAVLPFKALGDGGNDELLGLGMADAMIVRFSHLSKLSVIPTNSIFKYAGHDTDAVNVGRELGVDAVLTGTIQRAGEVVRVSAQLIRPHDGKTLWSDRFEERFTDIFALQDSISQKVADALRLEVVDVRERLAIRHPANTGAYESYLMGLYFWNKRTKEGLTKAVEYFNDAIDKDPDYAVAFAQLADSYCLLIYYGYESQQPSRELYEKAKRLAQRSLDLDESLAEAHAAMALIQCSYDKDRAGAEQSYRRAVYLNPSYATAHQRYAWFLTYGGRLDEAIEQMKRAQQLDPLSSSINVALGQVLAYARQYDESIRYCTRALELEPDYNIAHQSIAFTYELKGMYAEAIDEFHKAKQINDYHGETTAFLGHALAVAGQRAIAESTLHDLKRRASNELVSHYGMALILAAVDQKNEAFKELESAVANGDFNATLQVRFDPRLDPIRNDPRFNELLREHNLAP